MDAVGSIIALIGGIGMILIFLVEIIIILLVILTLWRSYIALGIYIREHEPEKEGEKAEGPKEPEQK